VRAGSQLFRRLCNWRKSLPRRTSGKLAGCPVASQLRSLLRRHPPQLRAIINGSCRKEQLRQMLRLLRRERQRGSRILPPIRQRPPHRRKASILRQTAATTRMRTKMLTQLLLRTTQKHPATKMTNLVQISRPRTSHQVKMITTLKKMPSLSEEKVARGQLARPWQLARALSSGEKVSRQAWDLESRFLLRSQSREAMGVSSTRLAGFIPTLVSTVLLWLGSAAVTSSVSAVSAGKGIESRIFAVVEVQRCMVTAMPAVQLLCGITGLELPQLTMPSAISGRPEEKQRPRMAEKYGLSDLRAREWLWCTDIDRVRSA
jgi:hypothetical protein